MLLKKLKKKNLGLNVKEEIFKLYVLLRAVWV